MSWSDKTFEGLIQVKFLKSGIMPNRCFFTIELQFKVLLRYYAVSNILFSDSG